MTRYLPALVAAALVSASPLVVSGAYAQTDSSIMQLQESASADLASIGIAEYPVDTLTLSQLSEIKLILGTDDGEAVKKEKIESLLGMR